MTALLTAVLAFGALAGCTGNTTGGNPTTAPTTGGEQTQSQPTSDSSGSGLSIAKYVSKPCDILTPAQVAQLGSLKAPKPGTSSLGPKCLWDGQDVTKNSTYEISVTEDRDVDDMVANLKNSPIFKETKDGDVRLITNDDTDGTLHCMTIVGVSKTDSVSVQVSIAAAERTAKPGCAESEKVAKMIITNLKG